MKQEWERKWHTNLAYSEKNYKELQKLYGGMSIIVINEQVIFATDDRAEWKHELDNLRSDEFREAYLTYIPREDEVLVF